MFIFSSIKTLTLCFVLCLMIVNTAKAQTTEFTYQGSLSTSGSPASGNHDFEFALFDALAGGTQIGSTLTRNTVAVASGTFAVRLDFGSQFPGAARFLEIRVRTAGGGGFTTLSPRQAVNSAPYSVKSLNADVATNSSQLGGVAANQYVTTATGGTNFIQNTMVQQPASNFNIGGNGTAGGTLSGNAVNAATQYNIGGSKFLSGLNNSIYLGFGTVAPNTTGNQNLFFGSGTGGANTTGGTNSFFGDFNGSRNTTGSFNAAFGWAAGTFATTGERNTYLGSQAGTFNETGSNNTFVGSFAQPGTTNLSNANAIGAFSQVNQSNSLVLGSINGLGNGTVDTNVGIGTPAPQQRLHVNGDEILSTGLGGGFKFRDRGSASSVDDWVWYSNGNIARFFRAGVGDLLTVKTNGNVGIGTANPNAKLQVAGGSVYIASPNSLIITSPNGACWFITVGNTGALSTFSVTCP